MYRYFSIIMERKSIVTHALKLELDKINVDIGKGYW